MDFLEGVAEAAVPAAAAGGVVAAGSLLSMPPLPMTMASGIPPGLFISVSALLSTAQHRSAPLSTAQYCSGLLSNPFLGQRKLSSGELSFP